MSCASHTLASRASAAVSQRDVAVGAGGEDCGMPCAARGKAVAKKYPARCASARFLRLRFTNPSSAPVVVRDAAESANVLHRICFILTCAEEGPGDATRKR